MAVSSVPPVIAVKPVKAHPSRRGTIRVAAKIPAELVFSYGSGDVIPASTVDIGMDGMCVETRSIVDSNAIRAIRISLGNAEIEIEVGSRWSMELGGNGSPVTGLVFESLDDAKRTALWDFIQDRGRDLGSFLSSCDGLDQLNFEEAHDLALATRLRIVRRDELIYRGGDEQAAASICALMSGSVALEPALGQRSQRIALVEPRQLFGGLPMIAGCMPFERAVALEEATVLEFSGYAVENLLNTRPHLGVALIRATSFHWMTRFAAVLERSLNSEARLESEIAGD